MSSTLNTGYNGPPGGYEWALKFVRNAGALAAVPMVTPVAGGAKMAAAGDAPVAGKAAPAAANPDTLQAVAFAAWIEDTLPCFTGPVPQEWTQRVWKEARQRGLGEKIVRLAFALVRKSGYDFPEDSPGVFPAHIDVTPPNNGPSMGPIDADEIQKNWIATARILETRFEVAEAQNRYDEEQELARAFAELLTEVLRVRAEKAEIEILDEAPFLAKVVEKDGETYEVLPGFFEGDFDPNDAE